MTHLVTYATPDMSISAEILKRSAKLNGIDKVYQWNRAALEQTEFYTQNKELLDQPRGSGYWAWKPFIILELLSRLPDDDLIIYSDAGIEVVAHVGHIMSRMTQHLWLFSNMFPHAHWCKSDVPAAMTSRGWAWSMYDKQCQASVIFIRVSNHSKEFVKEWLQYCLMPGLIDDSPSKQANHSEFKEHRHDQAILTTLAYREGIRLHWWPAIYNAGNFIYEKTGYTDDYPVLFHHHRRRNNEWTLTDPLNQHITNYFKRKYPDLV